MAKAAILEIVVTREKGRAIQIVKKWDDLFVLHPLAANVDTDLPKMDTPLAQQAWLTFGDVLVENVHADNAS